MSVGRPTLSYSSYLQGNGFTLGALPLQDDGDFSYCHERYGTGLNSQDCANAVHLFPESSERVVYSTLRRNPYYFPQVRHSGDCTVTIDLTTPSAAPQRVTFVPTVIRGLAAGVVQECVVERRGIGGFATFGFRLMAEHMNNPATDLRALSLNSARFLTVTVSGPGAATKPGTLDPYIPLKLYASRKGANGESRPANEDPFANAFLAMSSASSSSSESWWDIVSEYVSDPVAASADDMTYECDSSLGAPILADCSQLEYSQLRPPSDTLTVGPDSAKTLSSNTCDVTISSAVSISITWAQIGAALDALINICVANPLKSASGGKAYFGSKGFSIHSKKKRSEKVSGLNALPPDVNMTLSQSGHSR